jgi:hypothetical protein
LAGGWKIIMAIYRPTYRDPNTNEQKQSKIWWYNFTFGGRRVQESSKSPRKTIAMEAEKNRRCELEKSFNHIEAIVAKRGLKGSLCKNRWVPLQVLHSNVLSARQPQLRSR